MKPYYEDSLVTIYLGDCRDLLPQLMAARSGRPFELLMADPPYGINHRRGVSRGAAAVNGREKKTFCPTSFHGDASTCVGDDEPFDPVHLWWTANDYILWGANNYATSLLRDSSGWLIWDKRCGTSQNDQSDAELAWTTLSNTARICYHLWDGFRKATQKDQPRIHPMEKPVALWSWCLAQAPGVTEIIDPYCGSGSSLRAAKNAGIRAIGMDIEERWCEASAQLAAQEVFAFS